MNNQTNNTNKPLWEVVQNAHRDYINECSPYAVRPSKEFAGLRFTCDSVEVDAEGVPMSYMESKCWHWFMPENPLALNVLQMKLHESSGSTMRGIFSQLKRLVDGRRPYTLCVTLYNKQRGQTESTLVENWKGLDSLSAQHLVLMGHQQKMHIYQVSTLSELRSLYAGDEGLCLSHADVITNTIAKKTTTNASDFLLSCKKPIIEFIKDQPDYMSTIAQPALSDNDDANDWRESGPNHSDVKTEVQTKLIFRSCGQVMPDADDFAANLWFYNFYKRSGKERICASRLHSLITKEGHDVQLHPLQLKDRVPPKKMRLLDLTIHMRVIAQIYDKHLTGLTKHKLSILGRRSSTLDFYVFSEWLNHLPNIRQLQRSAITRLVKYHYQAEMIQDVRSRAIQRALNALNTPAPISALTLTLDSAELDTEPAELDTEPAELDTEPKIELTEMITDTVVDLADSIKDNGRDIIKLEKQIVLILNVLKEITIALGDRDAATRH